MWRLFSALFLGWSLGANDASNVFGTAVSSRMVRFWTAAILCAGFAVLGAVLQGEEGLATYSELSTYGVSVAFVVAMTSALTVTLMTLLKLPVSTSQAVVGAMIAAGLFSDGVHWGSLGKVVACWAGTPVGALVAAMILYRLLGALLNRLDLDLFAYDAFLRRGLILAGCWGAYALGANNVANVTGPFVASGLLSPTTGVWLGGLAIAAGVLTYSYPVMMTVGKGIVSLNAFSALVVVTAEAVTVHVYAAVGVPVSTSQAVVGAVIGIGLLRDARTINTRTLGNVALGWLFTPAVAFAATWAWLWIERAL
jgi:inorganic phosphate transporter, PiT family